MVYIYVVYVNKISLKWKFCYLVEVTETSAEIIMLNSIIAFNNVLEYYFMFLAHDILYTNIKGKYK